MSRSAHEQAQQSSGSLLADRQYKRVAVLPFTDGGGLLQSDVARRIGEKLAVALTQDGTYEVYSRSELNTLLDEHDLEAAGIVDNRLALNLGRLTSVQLLVTGSCSQPEVAAFVETQDRPTGVGVRHYARTREYATVSCSVRMTDTRSGKQVAAFHEVGRAYASSAWPKGQRDRLVELAEDRVVSQILRRLASQRISAMETASSVPLDATRVVWGLTPSGKVNGRGSRQAVRT